MTERIVTFTLDEKSLASRTPEIEHERNVALNDLLHENAFSVVEAASGPYDVVLSLEDRRLVFDIGGENMEGRHRILLPTQPLKRLIRDYFLMCESYFEALKEAKPHRLEAIDMGRRGMHNEGSEQLIALLEGKISVDFNTARRLFTLVCVLHLK